MDSLYFLIPLSLLMLIGGVCVYFWAVKQGQYDDLDREGERILFDDETDDAPIDQQDSDKMSQDKK
ncbi:cbb3-type cytochrome oxidase assembly protein CcoS [Porticoccaceae bacterium LTM1]|nr:cbb3-type cytochrome oxidase assembly protein CcoS [Porticoccaceae bacterium LTM1]